MYVDRQCGGRSGVVCVFVDVFIRISSFVDVFVNVITFEWVKHRMNERFHEKWNLQVRWAVQRSRLSLNFRDIDQVSSKVVVLCVFVCSSDHHGADELSMKRFYDDKLHDTTTPSQRRSVSTSYLPVSSLLRHLYSSLISQSTPNLVHA